MDRFWCCQGFQMAYLIFVAFALVLVSFCQGIQLMDPGVLTNPDLMEQAMLLGLEVGANEGIEGGKKRGSRASLIPELWFGPRLGRKKRNSEEELAPGIPVDTSDKDDESIMGPIKASPWFFVPFKPKGITRSMTYTPRLGRSSKEEDEDYHREITRSYQYIPRLGKKRAFKPNYQPRLGRSDLYYSSRVQRSVSAPQSNKNDSSR